LFTEVSLFAVSVVAQALNEFSNFRPAPGILRRDVAILFLTRFTRLFAYGALSVILVLYLKGLGLTEPQIGLMLTLTLAGDAVVSLFLSTRADRAGRRRMLIIGALLMTGAGFAFASAKSLLWLTIAGTIGVISPSGNEVGPFLSIEQAALSQVVADRIRTSTFAWYTLTGSVATALGSLAGGFLPHVLQTKVETATPAYRSVVLLYAALGMALTLFFSRLSAAAEANVPAEDGVLVATGKDLLGIGHSGKIVLKLSSLFGLDAFGGGFVVQSFAAYWFHLRFGVDPATLGAIFFGANLFAGISALLAARLAWRFGLVNTMVFTHLPSNILLILVPLMPTLALASLVLLLRFSISQMDVPTRQSYTMAVVRPEERSAAAGVTGVARTMGASVAPLFVGLMFANPSFINAPFFIAGVLKIAYDLMLYKAFVSLRPPEEIV
jgi:MFS family permease